MIYLISKIVNAFILPPGIFVLTFTLATFFAKRFKKIFLLFAILLWFLSSYIGAKILIQPLENKVFEHGINPPNAVVVLGAGDTKGTPNLPLTPMGVKRILWGLMIAQKKNLPLIYSGFENKYAQETIKEIINSFHIPFKQCHTLRSGCYIIEGKSKDTYENAKFTKKLFTGLGIQKPSVILVTSAYHMPRSYALFKYFGFDITVSKTDYQLDEIPDIWNYLPRIDNFLTSYYALHEYLGLASLYLRGILK